MKLTKFNLLVFAIVIFVTKSFSQQPKHYNIYSGFALGGGVTQYDILTDNFEVSPQRGWFVKASATIDIPHKWYNMSYGMQVSQNKLDIASGLSNIQNEEVALNYKIMTAQLALLWHAKIFGNYLTFDFGPMAQYNTKLELIDKKQKEFVVKNHTKITANDISDVSNVHLIPAVGFTLGYKFFKLRAQYMYTPTNLFGRLNKKDLEFNNDAKLKGNQSMLLVGAMFTFTTFK